MPVFPVTKFPTPDVNAPYIINQDLEKIFVGDSSLTEQPIPIYSVSEDAGILARLIANDDLVQYPIPSAGVLSNFRYFQISSGAGSFDINFINATQVTSTTVLQPTNITDTLFTNNTTTITVNKGDLVNWQIKFANPPTTGRTVECDILSFRFKPTSL